MTDSAGECAVAVYKVVSKVKETARHPRKGKEEDKMKKLTSLLLVFALVFACIGCGSDNGSTAGTEDTAQAEAGTEDASGDDANAETEDAGEVAEPEAEDAGEAAEPETEDAAEAEPEETQAEDAGEAKSEGVMTYEEYVAADLDTEVVVETYVQAKQSWWEDKATLYTQDKDGAYFVYNVACSEEDYEKLTPGTKIKVTGFKGEWSGEVEIMDGTFEIEEGNYVAEPLDVTSYLGKDELIDYQNQYVSFKGMTVEAAGQDDAGNDVAFLYAWDGSGQEGDDLYFNVSLDGETYTFTVESYLCDSSTDVYKAVKELKIGDKIDMEGFLYWYEGVNPHITSVKAAN